MSVRANERKEGNLQVLDLCSKLTKYTIDRCSSEKVFPKKNRWIMSNKVSDLALDAMINIRSANSVYVNAKQDYELRRKYQNIAHASLDALLGLIDIAYRCFNVESGTIEYWSRLVIDTDSKLATWMKSDKDRYKKYN